MCYEQRDSVVSRLCKERDELRQLLEKQFEAYKQAVEAVLLMDSIIADRDQLKERLERCEDDLA